MSIYQISKIQHRRGKYIDLPQLSAAEIGWSIDSQELFIGNGSVAEGSPSIGNTKVLTEHDNILQLLAQYQYKATDPTIQTGPSPNFPVKRSLQDRLDDEVSNYAFDIIPDTPNQADYLQNALHTLFANAASVGFATSRVTLYFSPGEYNIEKPVYIPSFTTIIGAGIDKTIFKFTGTGSFIFASDEMNYDHKSPSYLIDVTSFSPEIQPKHCRLADFTIHTNISTYGTPLVLNCARNSILTDIKIKNTYKSPAGVALFLYSSLSFSEFHSNTFNNIQIENFEIGLYSYSKFYKNRFSKFYFSNCRYGIYI